MFREHQLVFPVLTLLGWLPAGDPQSSRMMFLNRDDPKQDSRRISFAQALKLVL